jgi:arsenite methyltransferase
MAQTGSRRRGPGSTPRDRYKEQRGHTVQTEDEIKAVVKRKYAEIVTEPGSCCGGGCGSPTGEFMDISEDYANLDGYNPDADLGLGCGMPTELAQMRAGHVVLDLGSGAGNDVFVARNAVGDGGRVIGVDMTPAMLDRANQNRAKLGYENVEFRLGEIEDLPVADTEVDVVISNCVLNLVPGKARAFSEIFRVLKPGGHFCISDVVICGELPPALRESAEMYVGCVAGALDKEEYLGTIRAAGFTGIEVRAQREITLDDEVLLRHMNETQADTFRRSECGIFSVTVVAGRPSA